MKHIHQYDANGKQLCCTREDKINLTAQELQEADYEKEHKNNHGSGEEHDTHEHSHTGGTPLSWIKMLFPAILSLLLLLAGITLDQWIITSWFQDELRVMWYIVAYIPVGLPVVKDAFLSVKKGDIFSEFFLMTIATAGAFAIGEYPEAVAVMLFYAIGEVFQTMAVSRAKGNIKALLDQRPDEVLIIDKGHSRTIKAAQASIGDIIQLKPGEKLALDGVLVSACASFNTAALTGESRPDNKSKGDPVLAGMINLHTVSQVMVTAAYTDSKLSRILEMVQHASAQKAPTELFIRKFAKIYTPIVVYLALAICVVPYFFITDYLFRDWLYRSLVFLVISCPCALVISIPLGYFGGIGAAGRNGILIKGGNFLDLLADIRHVVMDKTGTITEGVFQVQEVIFDPSYDRNEILAIVNALESHSSHPVATAIRQYVGEVDPRISLSDIKELPGYGLTATSKGKPVLVGNFKLMDQFNIQYEAPIKHTASTTIAVAYDQKMVGYLTIADRIKPDALQTITRLQSLGVQITMLSGDQSSVVNAVAKQLGIENAYGDLLPEDKVDKVKILKSRNEMVAFAGDGINDAPVVALSDVGIAMGGLGSDATIETADVVIQDDQPSKIPMAIRIGKQTKKIVWQNIGLAFGIKAIVLILGAGGLATMWEAVFADVGVALLAILNAIRIQKMVF